MSIKAMQQALDSLDEIRILLWKESRVFSHVHSSIDSLRIAIEDEKRRLLSTPEPKQNAAPVGYVYSEYGNPRKNVALSNDSIPNGTPVYLHPAPRKFVRLSEEEMDNLFDEIISRTFDDPARIEDFGYAIQSALEEKNK